MATIQSITSITDLRVLEAAYVLYTFDMWLAATNQLTQQNSLVHTIVQPIAQYTRTA